MDGIEQKFLSNELALTGLTNLTNISADTILKKIGELYGFSMDKIIKIEIITRKNKKINKPFNLIYISF
jgi:hypothetical protein